MKIKVEIEKKNAVLAGSNECGEVEKDIDITKLTEAERKTLARLMSSQEGRIVRYYDRGIFDTENLQQFLRDVEMQEQEEQERQKKERAEAIAEFRSAFAARKTTRKSRSIPYRGQLISWDVEYPFMYDTTYVTGDELTPEYKAWEKSLEEKNEAAAAAAKRVVDDEIAAKVAARDEWIAAHGSKRLKMAAKEGIECQAIYRDERLALERAGWQWAEDYRGEYDDPRNPPLSALEDLQKARKTAPDAKLVYWEAEIDGEPDMYGDIETKIWNGYCAVAQFMEKKIVFGLPNDLLKR